MWRDADTDSLTVTTAAVDTVFTNPWTTAVIKFRGCTGLIRYATSVNDTTSWSTRKWYIMEAGEFLIIQRDKDSRIVGLYRLEYKCASLTGALFITGIRNANVY